MQILTSLGESKIENVEAVQQISRLFEGHDELLRGVNVFLPEGSKIDVPERPAPQPMSTVLALRQVAFRFRRAPRHRCNTPLQVEQAFNFLDQAKAIFAGEPGKYQELLLIIKSFKSGHLRLREVIQHISPLFEGHDELKHGFNVFLPAWCRIDVPEHESEPMEAESTAEQPADEPIEDGAPAATQFEAPSAAPMDLDAWNVRRCV